MSIKNEVDVISNYTTYALDKCLREYGERGYKLVSTEIAKNSHGVEVMYLFFTKEE